MKIYLEGSVEEIEQFLYGGDEAEGECNCERANVITPAEQLKLDLAKAISDAVDRTMAGYPL